MKRTIAQIAKAQLCTEKYFIELVIYFTGIAVIQTLVPNIRPYWMLIAIFLLWNEASKTVVKWIYN